MGCAQNNLKSGYSLVTPQFLMIGTDEMPLQSIAAIGEGTSDNVNIQTLDAAGYTVDSYLWNDWVAEKPCWVNDSFEPVEDVTFAAGQGLWIGGASVEQGVQTAGKVGKEDVVFNLRSGYVATGNPYPVAIDLQDIIAQGEGTSDNVNIQTLDAAGYTVDSYLWNDWVAEKPCWVNDSFEPVEGVIIQPGQGLWVGGSSTEQSIRFPAPEL